MTISLEEAKKRLDSIIDKGRVDLYKPIQIAEVLRRSRIEKDINTSELSTFQNPSLKWRNEVTLRLTGKQCTSSARYQHDVWNSTAMPPAILTILDAENKRTNGLIERYIYIRYTERHGMVTSIISTLENSKAETFQLAALFQQFNQIPGIRRSIDKAYEIVTHSLFETVITALETKIKVIIPQKNQALLEEFADLAQVLLGLGREKLEREETAHLYRVGVTNAADRGLDMWANFGPAVQVKHLTLNNKLANEIVDQVESDHIVIVCRDTDANVIETFARQISWGKRVRGIVKESDLIGWYERCLRGKFSSFLASPLLKLLADGFKAEFPQAESNVISSFLEKRGYITRPTEDRYWLTETEKLLTSQTSLDS